MLLTVDIGNTNITLGGYVGEKLEVSARIATDSRKTSDQYAVELKSILDLNDVAQKVNAAIISSVVPEVTTSIKFAIEKLFNIEALVLGPGVKTGLNIRIDNPAQLGADLAAGAVAASVKYELPAIIIDMGTATTISLLNENGEFLGGAIAAGVSSTLEALTKNTTLLPSINIETPKKVVGTNTVESMQSGLIFGTASMIDGMIDRFKKNLTKEPTVIATGGRAKAIVKECNHKIIYDDNLLLDGLLFIYKKNFK
mgnify:CR=1 FL=1